MFMFGDHENHVQLHEPYKYMGQVYLAKIYILLTKKFVIYYS